MAISITPGSGAASVASEAISGANYQQIKVVDGTASSTNKWQINSDGSAQVHMQGSVATAIISGSISATFTPPANQSVSGTVQTDVRASVATVIIGGSIAATYTPPANQSVSGTVQTDVRGSVATVIIGGSIATATTNSSVMLLNSPNVIGSVIAYQGAANWNVSGSVAAIQSGTVVTSIVSTIPSSVIVGASIFGLPPVNVTNTNLNVSGSVAAWINSSDSSVIAMFQNSSILAIPGNASFIGYWDKSPSVVGTYAEDAAHTTGDKGVFTLGVRNDTQASVTSADLDYSPVAVDLAGAVISRDAPITKWIQGTADLRVVQGASVAVLAAQGASVFTYVREIQVANFGPSSVLVTFAGGLGSILSYTIAPAGGGSNIVTRIKTGANSAFTASLNGTASVLISAQGFNAKE